MYLYKESETMLNDLAMRPLQPQAGFTVHYWGVNARLPGNPVHRHSFFEICYVMDGQGVYSDDGIDYPLHQGVMFFSRPGVTHQIRTMDGLFLLFVAFEPDDAVTDEETLEAFRSLADKGRVYVADASGTAACRLWESLLLRSDGSSYLPESAVAPAAYALLMSFLTVFGEQERRTHAHPRQDNGLLRRAKLYIRDNLSSPLSLREIAGYLNVSERHLSRLFAGGIHESFTDYIRQERIRLAARLLLESDLPIKTIAEESGFSSVHYFTRTFTREKKVSPGRFRSKHLN